MTNCDELPATEQSECWVREYFEQRDWLVAKLAEGREKSADFHICKDICFLCEVKTVESVYSNFPWAPSQVHETRRREKRALYKQCSEENPDSQILITQAERDYVYEGKFQGTVRFGDKEFNGFADDMCNFFTTSAKVQHLPFLIRLDGHYLYVPYGNERKLFYEWLENQLVALAAGEPIDHRWSPSKTSDGAVYLGMSYPIHHASTDKDVDVFFELSITTPSDSGKLELDPHSYGELNQDAISQLVEGAAGQLKALASREKFQGNAQVIALAFARAVDDYGSLYQLISWLLQQHASLNAIAVLDRDWNASNHAMETHFIVIHNTWHPNEHRETITQAFADPRNLHIDSNTLEIPASWLPE